MGVKRKKKEKTYILEAHKILFNIIYSQHDLLAYGDFFDHEITVLEFFGVSGKFWEAANIFDIELSESTKIEFGRNPCKFFNYFLMGDKVYYKFIQAVKEFGFNDALVILFLSGCLYIGKGQADRAFKHFSEAIDDNIVNDKVNAIRKIWDNGDAIVVVTFFHDSTHHVASTREAILLDGIGIENLTNIRRGSYYGGVKLWNKKVLQNMGKYYLLKVMQGCMSQHVTAVFREDIQ